MMRQDTLVRSAWALAAALTLGACSGQHRSPAAPSPALADAATAAGGTEAAAGAYAGSSGNFEIRFMTAMIDHHSLSVKLADLCVVKAIHAELRAMCETIVTAQAGDLWNLQIWMEGWHGILYDPSLTPGDLKLRERLAALSGEAFEIAFLEQMIRHYRTAVSEGGQCVSRADHGELRDTCASMVDARSAAIAQMQAWLCQWYGRC